MEVAGKLRTPSEWRNLEISHAMDGRAVQPGPALSCLIRLPMQRLHAVRGRVEKSGRKRALWRPRFRNDRAGSTTASNLRLELPLFPRGSRPGSDAPLSPYAPCGLLCPDKSQATARKPPIHPVYFTSRPPPRIPFISPPRLFEYAGRGRGGPPHVASLFVWVWSTYQRPYFRAHRTPCQNRTSRDAITARRP